MSRRHNSYFLSEILFILNSFEQTKNRYETIINAPSSRSLFEVPENNNFEADDDSTFGQFCYCFRWFFCCSPSCHKIKKVREFIMHNMLAFSFLSLSLSFTLCSRCVNVLRTRSSAMPREPKLSSLWSFFLNETFHL